MDRDKGRVTLSTKKLEKEPGDMLRDPQLVFENAEAMADQFRARVASAESGYIDDDIVAAEGGYVPNPMQPEDGQQQQFAFDTQP